MGATSSFIAPPEGIDSATFKELFPEHFSKALFRELADRSGRISAATLQEFAMQATDVFLSHDWGTDELGRSNHKRVGVINRILKEKGLRTWFDEEEMKGNVQEQMQRGIDKASCIIVFVTENYMEKVSGKGVKGDMDNCRFEFSYVSISKSPRLIIPVVMEPRCYDNSGWFGPVGAQLRAKLYVDFASDDAGRAEAAAEGIIREIRGYVPLLIKERIAEAMEKYGQAESKSFDFNDWAKNAAKASADAKNASDFITTPKKETPIAPVTQEIGDAKQTDKAPKTPNGAKADPILFAAQGGAAKQEDESKYVDEVCVNSPSSLYTLGRHYETGDGVERDLAEAVRCYWEAAEKGSADAQFALGKCYEEGKGVKADPAEAFNWFNESANGNLVIAQRRVAECYRNGLGVPRDDKKVFMWYNVAVKYGDVSSIFDVAQCHELGIGTKISKLEAFENYLKAANLGHMMAQKCTADCYLKGEGIEASQSNAIKWYEKAAEQGDLESQFRLGMFNWKGYEVRPKSMVGETDEEKSEAGKTKPITDKELENDKLKIGQVDANADKTTADKTNPKIENAKVDKAGRSVTLPSRLMPTAESSVFKKAKVVTKVDKVKASEWFSKSINARAPKDEIMLVETCIKRALAGIMDAMSELGLCYEKGIGVFQNDVVAFEWYSEASLLFSIEAERCLGHCYMNGRGVEVNRSIAVEWYKKAANRGDAEAQRCLGKCFEEGTGVDPDKARAFEWYRKAAEQGDPEAEYRIGKCYENGSGVAVDKTVAFNYILKAAIAGVIAALRDVGASYVNGSGVEKDLAKGLKWYMVAAEKGDSEAQLRVAQLYSVDAKTGDEVNTKTEAFLSYLRAAERGRSDCQYVIAKWYEFGIGAERNVTEASRWYLKAGGEDSVYACEVGRCYFDAIGVAADKDLAFEWYIKALKQDSSADKVTCLKNLMKSIHGDAETQYEVGKCFETGTGFHMSLYCARSWYLAAAKQGHVQAQFKAADLYEKGFGDENTKDIRVAFEWYLKAAEQGHAEAQFRAGRCYENGSGAEQSLASAFQWYQKAVKQDHAEAMFSLGMWYHKGIHVGRDDIQALQLISKSADLGNADAMFKLGLWNIQGNTLQQNYEQALNWFRKASKSEPVLLYLAKVGMDMLVNFWATDKFENEQAFLDFHFDLKAALQGDANAQCKVGRRWKDTEFAYEWYLLPAEQGSPEGQRMVGECFYHGRGVTQDYKLAVMWHEKAAKQGDIEAGVVVAECLYYGEGLEQNKVEAYNRFQEFAEKSHARAQCWAGDYWYWVRLNKTESFRWYLKAAEQGQARAMREVGYFYGNGEGVQQNPALSFQWYLKAAELGDAKAEFEICFIYEHGIGEVPRDLQKAYEWCNKAAEQDFKSAITKLPELAKLLKKLF